MNRSKSEPRTNQHRHDRLRNHRHVDQHHITLLDVIFLLENIRQEFHFFEKFAISQSSDFSNDRWIMNGRCLMSVFADVTIETVVSHVQQFIVKPTRSKKIRLVEHFLPALKPRDLLGMIETGAIDPCVAWTSTDERKKHHSKERNNLFRYEKHSDELELMCRAYGD